MFQVFPSSDAKNKQNENIFIKLVWFVVVVTQPVNTESEQIELERQSSKGMPSADKVKGKKDLFSNETKMFCFEE